LLLRICFSLPDALAIVRSLRNTSVIPTTAISEEEKRIFTPACSMFFPPTPQKTIPGANCFMAFTRFEPCKSAEASPATITTNLRSLENASRAHSPPGTQLFSEFRTVGLTSELK